MCTTLLFENLIKQSYDKHLLLSLTTTSIHWYQISNICVYLISTSSGILSISNFFLATLSIEGSCAQPNTLLLLTNSSNRSFRRYFLYADIERTHNDNKTVQVTCYYFVILLPKHNKASRALNFEKKKRGINHKYTCDLQKYCGHSTLSIKNIKMKWTQKNI